MEAGHRDASRAYGRAEEAKRPITAADLELEPRVKLMRVSASTVLGSENPEARRLALEQCERELQQRVDMLGGRLGGLECYVYPHEITAT